MMLDVALSTSINQKHFPLPDLAMATTAFLELGKMSCTATWRGEEEYCELHSIAGSAAWRTATEPPIGTTPLKVPYSV